MKEYRPTCRISLKEDAKITSGDETLKSDVNPIGFKFYFLLKTKVSTLYFQS